MTLQTFTDTISLKSGMAVFVSFFLVFTINKYPKTDRKGPF